MVGVVVRDDDPRDPAGIQAVAAHEVEDLAGPWPEPGVDHHQLVAAVDDVHMAVEAMRKVEAIVAAAHEIHVAGQLHNVSSPVRNTRRCQAPVDDQVDPGDICGIVRCEVRKGRRDVIGRRQPVERHDRKALGPPLVHQLFPDEIDRLLGVGGARAHAVHANTVGREFDRHRLREVRHAGLGRRVMGELGARPERGDRRREEDHAAVAGLHHRLCRTLSDPKVGGEVHADHLQPRLVLHLKEGLLRPRGGVRDSHVDAPLGLEHGVHRPVAPIELCQLRRDRAERTPRSRSSAATSSARSPKWSTTWMAPAPSRANRWAVARPIPLPPPVIRTTLPLCRSVTRTSLKTDFPAIML